MGSEPFDAPTDPPANRRSPAIAAALSFVSAGLGHLYLGRPKAAVAWALGPTVLQLATALGFALGWLPGVLFMVASLVRLPWWLAALLASVMQTRPLQTYTVRRYNHPLVYATFFAVKLALVLATSAAIRTWLAETYSIPAASMVPTLEVGDLVLARKMPFAGRIARGDVVLFRYPKDPSITYVKRVIGLPGDRVRFEDHLPWLDGAPISRRALGATTWVDDRCGVPIATAWQETIDGRSWRVLTEPSPGSLANVPETIVPEGSVFVVGDNRDHSEDSRRWGFVSLDAVVGKPELVSFSFSTCHGVRTWRLLLPVQPDAG